ncbi:helix-turn-helix domain-containing protein [Streptomyces sp. NPDC001606]
MNIEHPPTGPAGSMPPGERVRRTGQAQGMSLAELGARTGYSAAQVSRLERGKTPMIDVDVLHRFARVLDIPPHDLGLAPSQAAPGPGAVSQAARTRGFPPLLWEARGVRTVRAR